MAENKKEQQVPDRLNPEQEELLDTYLQKLDDVYEQLKTSDKLQVEIETEHLKKILSR